MEVEKIFFKATAFILGGILVVFTFMVLMNFITSYTNSKNVATETATTTITTSSQPITTINFARPPEEGCLEDIGINLGEVANIFADVRKGLTCHFTINPKLPSFTFKLGANSAQNRIESLVIKEYDTSKTLQTLRVKMTSSPPADLPLFTTEDINFDDYQDIRIIREWNASGNLYFTYWLYDVDTNTFIENEKLSTFSNPTIITDTKTFTTNLIEGMAGCLYTRGTYAFINNTLTLLQEEKQIWQEKSKSILRQTRTLQNGTYNTSSGAGVCG